MFRHIAWFNEATVAPDAKGNLASPDAHVRRRCLIPARQLEAVGVPCSVFGNLHDADPAHVARHLQKLQTDIVVISNINGIGLFNQARMAKHLGCYVVADFGAQHVEEATFEKYAALADCVVVSDPPDFDPLPPHDVAVLVIPDCDDDTPSREVVEPWLKCFKQLKAKPPVCANSNQPLAENA
jgi:hypothetical protein